MKRISWLKQLGQICVLLVTLAACTSQQNIPAELLDEPAHRIYVVSEKWHSSLLIDAADMLPYAHHLKDDIKPYRQICVGWGDGDYFTGKDKSVPTAIKALVSSEYSALQLLGYYRSGLAQIAPEDRIAVAITEEGMRRLVAFIEDSLLLYDGKPVSLKAYEENTGVFYQGAETYSAKNNCNTWVSRALKAAGLPMSRENFVRTETVFNQAQKIHDAQNKRGLLPATLAEREAEKVLKMD